MDVDMEDAPLTKQQFRDSIPRRIKGLSFGLLSPQDIVAQSVVEVSDRHVYDIGNGAERPLTKNGPLDPRLGTSSRGTLCETCNREMKDCNGHFGYVKLSLPAFHVGYLKKIIEVLQCICKECSRVMLDEKPRRTFLKSVRRPGLDGMQMNAIGKKVTAECRKCKYCPYCGAVNGTVKKVTGHPLKIVHEKFRWYVQSTAKSKIPPPAKIQYDKSFEEARKSNPELEKHLKKAVDDMNPLRVLNLFRRVKASDCDLLLMSETRPESLIWQYVPAPPVSLRPSVATDGGATTNEDDLTNKLGDIIQMSQIIRAGIDTGQPTQTIAEQWDYLQIQLAMYINSDVPGLTQAGFGKPIRGLCQRLKGKQGRFRGNLSGKRVDFSGRTVISPDPNLSIEEVAVPQRMAVNLTYPERVTDHNIEKLKACIRRGKKWPGANYVTKNKQGGRRIALEIIARFGVERLVPIANELEVGDVVDRHLEDGDIVLFNRQPSLHKLSILSHRAKIRQWKTLRMNECVCTPYNADFDGDEMNLHVPQTEEARTEATTLMGVKHNITTPKDGTPIIAATQDFITAAYLLSSKNRFYDRKTFVQIVGYMFNADAVRDPVKKKYVQEAAARDGFLDIDLPEPVILKPEALWTGKQVFNLLMRPSKKSKVMVNMDAACKEYKPDPSLPPDLSHDDAWLVIRNSEIMCGVMDKNTLGSGKKDSIFYVILRDYGGDALVQSMNRLAKLSARWLTNEGFSIGINDVWPSLELVRRKDLLIEAAYAKCDLLIKDFQAGRLKPDAGCDEEMTMENKISGLLSDVRQKGGAICFEQLSNWNAPTIMAKSGSKGSNINVSQMVALVGQQIIGGSRVQNGFQDRSLPHFPKASRQPPSKGFVRNSFFSGLTPYEFIFHAMSGREGLVDTAVKTAETGYMSRRLMKSLEDLSVQYDDTVRNSSSGVVQIAFGDDKLDPDALEGKAKPVNFERTFLHSQTSKWNNNEVSLLPFEIMDKTHRILEAERKKLQRTSLFGEKLEYDDETEAGIDQFESHRDFLQTIMEFISVKAENYAHARDHVGMMDGREDDERVDWEVADDLKQRHLADGVAKVSDKSLKRFLKLCLTKYEKAKVQPGHAVGAVGAQSIGEPGTQMTLKTFHFAGVAGMSITQGVPRIKEIINASKVISTPVITCELVNKRDDEAAQLVKSRIEKTYLKDVVSWIEEVWTENTSYIQIKIDQRTIRDLQLDVSVGEIRRALIKSRGLKLDESSVRTQGNFISVYVEDFSEGRKKRGRTAFSTKEQNEEYFIRVQNMKRLLPNIPLVGYPDCSRCVVSKNPKKQDENMLIVEGYGLRACMNTPGLIGTKTKSNSVMENMAVLGIEAARTTIIDELASVMGNQMDIDPRHMQLLADVMTYKGDVLGITRFGLAKMRDSVLQLASFEKTPDHLFDAAVKGKTDNIEGVSECIIMGQSMSIGTGGLKVIRRLGLGMEDFERKDTLFEDAFKEVYGTTKK